MHGTVKWDGCSNWDMPDCMHACERNELLRYSEVMVRCWDHAKSCMKEFAV